MSTYLGGRASELNGGVAVDSGGDVHVTGATRSPDFPIRRALQDVLAGVDCGPPPGVPCPDIYLTKFDRTRAAEFSTYLGGNAEEQGLGVAVDATGVVHVAGSTHSRRFPTRDAIQAKLGGAIDAFVARLAPGASCGPARTWAAAGTSGSPGWSLTTPERPSSAPVPRRPTSPRSAPRSRRSPGTSTAVAKRR